MFKKCRLLSVLCWHKICKNTIPQDKTQVTRIGKNGKLVYTSFMGLLKVRIIKLLPKYKYVIARLYLFEQIY